MNDQLTVDDSPLTANAVPVLRFAGFSGKWEPHRLNKANLKVIDGDRGINYPQKNDFSKSGYCLFLNAKNVTKAGFSFNDLAFISENKDIAMNKGKLKRGDLLLTTRGSIGYVALYDDTVEYDNIRINSGMVILRTTDGITLPNFLYFVFNCPAVTTQIKRIAFGSAQPQLTVKEINRLWLATPQPDEQQKIAAFLTSVDTKIEQLGKKKALLEKYKKGMMQKLFSQLLRFKDELGNDKVNGKAREGSLGCFPDWEEKRLKEVAKFSKGKGISKNDTAVDGETFCIRYGQLYTQYSEMIENVVSKTNVPIEELVLSHKNDVIIPASGETALDIATASCVTLDGVALGGDLNIIRSSEDGVFLAYYLNSDKKIDIARLAQGVSVVHLYQSQLESLLLAFPCKEEQTTIANFLTTLDHKIDLITTELNQAKTFKKGLLQQMFI